MAWLSADGRPLAEARTRGFLDDAGEHWRAHGFGLWIVEDPADSLFAGYAGLRHTGGRPLPGVELLYALRPECWGHGWITAAAGALIARECPRIGRRELVAYTLPGNSGSRRVMEKLGFQFSGEIVHAGRPHVLYRLTVDGPAR